MATHETGTGEFMDHSGDAPEGLDTHDEHEHEHEHDMSSSSEHEQRDEEKALESTESTGSRNDDEVERTKGGDVGYNEKGKKKIELQDQTNLLPTKQVIFVFMGLTCALFCSLLDQTMSAFSSLQPHWDCVRRALY